ncbi:MAG: hypothetical protein ABIP51_05945 [Bacteroidia bacterium]
MEKLFRLVTDLPLAGKNKSYTKKEWKRIYGYEVGLVPGASWVVSKSKREEAIEWWGNLNLNEKLLHCGPKFLGRRVSSLTGREIEIIYDVKCKSDKEIIDLICNDKKETFEEFLKHHPYITTRSYSKEDWESSMYEQWVDKNK